MTARVVARIEREGARDVVIVERDDERLVLGALCADGREYVPLTEPVSRRDILDMAMAIAARDDRARTHGPALDHLAVGVLAMVADAGMLAGDVQELLDEEVAGILADVEPEGEG